MQPLKYTSIQKLVFGGRGLGHDYEDKATFILNALPGEEVGFFITKNKKTHFEGIAEEIVKASPDRIAPLEPQQYLSTSPWQILKWDRELYWKQTITKEVFTRISNVPEAVPIAATPEPTLHYRNKMEFGFTDNEAGELSLSIFKRGSKRKIAIKSSLLAEPIINQVAAQFVQWLKDQGLTSDVLKSLIIRSNGSGQAIAALFVNEDLSLFSYPEVDDNLLGYQIYFSNPKSPASVPTRLLHKIGKDHLVGDLLETKLKFGLLSFFQVNPPLFSETLTDIAQFLDPQKPIVDFYSGVGAIGLPLHKHYQSCTLVDSNKEAINYAKDNIRLNNITNCKAECIPAEKITELITPEKIIILDPPRAGLHKNVVKTLLTQKPERIIYLSCNLTTQARDLELLQESYELKFIKLYNYFPRTPHVECLCVIDLKE